MKLEHPRAVVAADSVWSGVAGLLTLARSRPIAEATGLPVPLVRAAGVAGLVWGGLLSIVARREVIAQDLVLLTGVNAVRATGLVATAAVAAPGPGRRLMLATAAQLAALGVAAADAARRLH